MSPKTLYKLAKRLWHKKKKKNAKYNKNTKLICFNSMLTLTTMHDYLGSGLVFHHHHHYYQKTYPSHVLIYCFDFQSPLYSLRSISKRMEIQLGNECLGQHAWTRKHLLTNKQTWLSLQLTLVIWPNIKCWMSFSFFFFSFFVAFSFFYTFLLKSH